MPGYLLHVNAGMQCPHLAPATIAPSQPRVLVSGQAVATMASQIGVLTCPFTVPPGKPQPCTIVKWSMPTSRVLVVGQPAMVQPMLGQGMGVAISPGPPPTPNGPPIVTAMQPRVFAT
jgi:hypothetical protein